MQQSYHLAGESDSSWCYSGAEGKMGHNSTFEEYGEKFAKNDIVGAFLELDGDEISMTFTKNGEDQGDAFQIPKEKLSGRALFPHIMSRNVKFEVNFGVNKAGEDKAEWKEKLEGDYIKAGNVAEEDRVRHLAQQFIRTTRAVDPHSFFADLDQAFHNTDSDPALQNCGGTFFNL